MNHSHESADDPMKKNAIDLGTRIYRVFLLAIVFGVLWVKEYLWMAFLLSLLLFLGDTLLMPVLRAAVTVPPAPRPRGRRRPQWEMMPTLPTSPGEEASEPAVEGGEDFREPPPPRRSAPRKR
jgi:hypothetical protein